MTKHKGLLKGYKVTLAALGIGIAVIYGGGAYYNYVIQSRAEAIAQRPGVRDEMERLLKTIDPHAFTDKGKIQSFEVLSDMSSFSPVNTLHVHVSINRDPDLSVSAQVDYDTEKEIYHVGTFSASRQLSDLLEGKSPKSTIQQ